LFLQVKIDIIQTKNKGMENITQNEINGFLQELRAAQKDGFPWGILKKGESATTHISALGQNAMNSVRKLGGRAIYHADRLLEQGRSEIERNFALALANHAKEVMKSIGEKDEYSVRATISGEGSDCCLWWTLSPYIFDELRRLEIDEETAVKYLLIWAKTGRPFHEVKDKEVNLLGLNIYNFAARGSCTFTLSRDPSGMSHQFARKEAKRLVRDVFLTDDFRKLVSGS